MAESQNSEALIIKRNDWREGDSRVVLYTKNFGKLSLVARGAKKFKSKIAGHIEPINLVDMMILKGKAFDYLGSAITKNSFLNIKGDLNALYFVGSALALFDAQVKEEAQDEELYNFLVTWLDLVDNRFAVNLDKETGELLYDYFVIKLLTILGYKPELRYCLDCRQVIKPGNNYLNLRLGGLICGDCLESNKQKYLPNEILKISDDCIKLLRIFSENNVYQVIKVNPAVIRELGRLVKSLVDFTA
jgi:DNA repair protein RecO (recombination protein O)